MAHWQSKYRRLLPSISDFKHCTLTINFVCCPLYSAAATNYSLHCHSFPHFSRGWKTKLFSGTGVTPKSVRMFSGRLGCRLMKTTPQIDVPLNTLTTELIDLSLNDLSCNLFLLTRLGCCRCVHQQ